VGVHKLAPEAGMFIKAVAVSSLVSCSAADLRYPPPSFLFSSAVLKASSSSACLMASL
jgi:hypothetical protein